tara:strand:- start:46 stop:174 length:129 start_codon:yes stop_codon:yes gene_type:complete
MDIFIYLNGQRYGIDKGNNSYFSTGAVKALRTLPSTAPLDLK